MPVYKRNNIEGLQIEGRKVPIVAFYSVQGGVGKSTLARKFAELVTVAPGRDGLKPNVLLVDLDVETEGLTTRLAQGLRQNFRTVHEVIAERNITVAQAITVTGSVLLASGNPSNRGQLYLMPAAPPDAQGLFDTIANIEKEELIKLLKDMITALVMQYDISCVVIDCAPGANPYTAAAATIADFPLLIGRNEQATYEKIRVLPERFREWYTHFQPARQRVIINAVTVKDLFTLRSKQYSVFDYIPLTTDVILETEGLPRTGSLRMLLFEKYIVDIIKQIFVGMNHLIPECPDVLGDEWIEALDKLEHCELSPKMRRLRFLRHFKWIGISLILAGIIFIGSHHIFKDLPKILNNIGMATSIVGILCIVYGLHTEKTRQNILTSAQKLVSGGADEVFRKLQEGVSHRKELDNMKNFADTIPLDLISTQQNKQQAAKKKQE